MRRQESWEGKRRKKKEKEKEESEDTSLPLSSLPCPSHPPLFVPSALLSFSISSSPLLASPLLRSFLPPLRSPPLPRKPGCPSQIPSGSGASLRVARQHRAQRLRMKAAGRPPRGPSLGTAQGLRGMCPPPRGSPHLVTGQRGEHRGLLPCHNSESL